MFSNEYYFVQAVGAVVIYDILRKETFDNINFWLSKLNELSGDVPFIIVGNKLDRKNERKVSFQEASQLAKKHNVEYYETSAKANQNVEEAFESLAIQILNTLK